MGTDVLYAVIISERAESNLDDVVNYLWTEWNETVKDKFLNNLRRVLHLLSVNP